MTAISASVITESAPNPGIKRVIFETAATADSGDTLAITLSTYGIVTLLGVTGYRHTTEGSVIVDDAQTTAVSAGVLTITVGGSGADNYKRVFEVIGK